MDAYLSLSGKNSRGLGAYSRVGAYLNKYGNNDCSYFHNVHLAFIIKLPRELEAVVLNDV